MPEPISVQETLTEEQVRIECLKLAVSFINAKMATGVGTYTSAGVMELALTMAGFVFNAE